MSLQNRFENKEHTHTPSSGRCAITRFFSFLFHPGKVYFKSDDTGVCAVCGIPIKTPEACRSVGFKIAYGIAGALIGIGYGCLILPIAHQVLLLVPIYTFCAYLLIEHILKTFVLAAFPWCPYNPEKYNVEQECTYVKTKNRENRKVMTAVMVLVGVIFLVCAIF